MTDHANSDDTNPLGQPTQYLFEYAPDLLFAIPRQPERIQLGLTAPLPFTGVDIWNAYELSWLRPGGRPQVAEGEIRIDAASQNIVESKSLKLYLNSFNDSTFESTDQVRKTIEKDICGLVEGTAEVCLRVDASPEPAPTRTLPAVNLDTFEPGAPEGTVNPRLLKCLPDTGNQALQRFHTNLFRSLCPITGQPDWADVYVTCRGPGMDPTSLLQYLISYRRHGGYHEQCVERIFADIQQQCGPNELTVYARFLRRGGVDINPFRSNFEGSPDNIRSWRQ